MCMKKKKSREQYSEKKSQMIKAYISKRDEPMFADTEIRNGNSVLEGMTDPRLPALIYSTRHTKAMATVQLWSVSLFFRQNQIVIVFLYH